MESSYTIGKGKLTHSPAGAFHIRSRKRRTRPAGPAPLSEVMG
jgi:hypothetical protein|uniref:Uncharacterized protein n=1 Tax=Variovorax paradoxus (strain S110) TaxID=543728 RepID=C5CWA3_VARPS